MRGNGKPNSRRPVGGREVRQGVVSQPRRPVAAVRAMAREDAAVLELPRPSDACNSRKCDSTIRRRNSGRSGPSCKRKWQESSASRMSFARNKACHRFPYRASDVFRSGFKTELLARRSPIAFPTAPFCGRCHPSLHLRSCRRSPMHRHGANRMASDFLNRTVR